MVRPGFRPSLAQTMRQQMLLQPRMLQSIEVLQLPAGELEAWLGRQAEENEALVVVPPARSHAALREATDAHDEFLQSQPARAPGLSDAIETQLRAEAIEAPLAAWVRHLLGALDARGFLSASDEELAESALEAELPLAGTPGGQALLAEAIATLQSFEPRGVGARDAVEALLLQLDTASPDYRALCRLLEEFLGDLAAGRAADVAARMGLGEADLQRLIDVLAELDPRPAEAVGESSYAITPDLVVLPRGGGFEVTLVRSHLPEVHIDGTVAALAEDRRASAADRRYVRRKLERARWVQEAVAQRAETLLRVASAVFERQLGFLTEGPRAMRALRMGDVAESLGLATSTVSRATANKHVQTPFGVHPLRAFFQASASEAGDAPARDAVRDHVRALIEGEDPRAPLSDDAIVARLSGEGTSIARRTVAKYRGELGFPSSYERKRG